MCPVADCGITLSYKDSFIHLERCEGALQKYHQEIENLKKQLADEKRKNDELRSKVGTQDKLLREKAKEIKKLEQQLRTLSKTDKNVDNKKDEKSAAKKPMNMASFISGFQDIFTGRKKAETAMEHKKSQSEQVAHEVEEEEKKESDVYK